MTTGVRVIVPMKEYEYLNLMQVKLYVGADVFEFVFANETTFHEFEIELPEGEPLQYDYQYEAFYRGGGSLVSGRRQATDRVLVIQPSRLDLGILDLEILCPQMPFESITVSVEVTNQRKDIVYPKPYAHDSLAELRLPFTVGDPINGGYRYKTRYELTSGRVVETDWCDSRANPLVVPNLFHERRIFQFVAVSGEEAPPPAFRLSVKHSDAYDVEEDFPISLVAGHPEETLKFGVIDPANAHFSYQGFELMPDGTAHPIPETELTSSVVVLQASAPT